MHGETTPWMERVLQLLEDGPQPYDLLVAQAGALIPPGVAWRQREVARRWDNRRREREPDTDITDEKLWVGRRGVMRKYIWGWERDGKLRQYHSDGRMMVELLRRE